MSDFTFYRGRVALAAVLRACRIRTGDHVLLQAFTCVAVPEAIIGVGGRPIYVDTSPNAFTMDERRLMSAVTDRTRAIVVQHTYGIPTNMPGVMRIAAERGIPVIEDCAHAMGSTVDGRLVGEIGVAAFYSFEASKPLFAGIGGSARVNDRSLRATLAEQYAQYREPSLVDQSRIMLMYLAHRVAYRPATFWTIRSIYRSMIRLGVLPRAYNKVAIDTAPAKDFQQRLGKLQLQVLAEARRHLEADIAHRESVAQAYRERITASHAIHPDLPPNMHAVYGRYPILSNRKDELLRLAPQMRVEIAKWYGTPVHPLEGEMLREVGYEPGSCPNAEALTTRVVSLPTGPLVGPREIDRAVELFAS